MNGHRAGMLLTLALAIVGIAESVEAAGSPPHDVVELTVATPPPAGEETWLRIRVGTLARGAFVRISTVDGDVLEVIQPFGSKAAELGAEYTVPLPRGFVTSGRARLRVDIVDAAGVAHAPSSAEIERMELINVPVSR